jgi:hypothetical protein
MDAEIFAKYVIDAMRLPPAERHEQMVSLHSQIYTAYLAALQAISTEQAGQPVNVGADHRTLGQVVGHITAWDRFGIQAVGDILAGVRHPRAVTGVEGFVDADGKLHNFKNVHEFNAYHARQQAGRKWVELQMEAIDAATALHALYTLPDLLTFQRLDHTDPWRCPLPSGAIIEDIGMGWCLWILLLRHYAVDHAVELQIEVVA